MEVMTESKLDPSLQCTFHKGLPSPGWGWEELCGMLPQLHCGIKLP